MAANQLLRTGGTLAKLSGLQEPTAGEVWIILITPGGSRVTAPG